MKKNRTFLVLLLAILFSCEKSEQEPLFELSISSPLVVAADENGAEFSAEVQGSRKEEILEYGFIWSLNRPPSLDTDFKVSRFGVPNILIQLRAENELRPFWTYYVASFLITSDKTYVSESVSFIVKGS